VIGIIWCNSDTTWCNNRIILQQLIAISLLFNGYQLWPEKCSEYRGSYSVLKLIVGIHIEVTAMKYYSRRLVKPEHLNPANTLFGGQLLSWIDEEAAIFAACQMKSTSHVTKLISEINFMTPAHQGDVIEFGLELVSLGHSSITVSCQVRNKMTQAPVVSIDKMVFVHVNAQGLPVPHGIRANAA